MQQPKAEKEEMNMSTINTEGRIVLCGANSYEQKFYLNEEFSSLPQGIQDELKIICVTYTEDIGGILTMEFEEDGSLFLRYAADDADYLFDEIGAGLKIRQIQTERRELLESLELYYKVFYLGLDVDAE